MKALVTALVLCLIAGVALAADPNTTTTVETKDTSGANFEPTDSWLVEKARLAMKHDHEYEDKDTVSDLTRDDPYGVGLDLEVVRFPADGFLQSVNCEGKYDINNDETSVFIVVKASLPAIFDKLNME